MVVITAEYKLGTALSLVDLTKNNHLKTHKSINAYLDLGTFWNDIDNAASWLNILVTGKSAFTQFANITT